MQGRSLVRLQSPSPVTLPMSQHRTKNSQKWSFSFLMVKEQKVYLWGHLSLDTGFCCFFCFYSSLSDCKEQMKTLMWSMPSYLCIIRTEFGSKLYILSASALSWVRLIFLFIWGVRLVESLFKVFGKGGGKTWKVTEQTFRLSGSTRPAGCSLRLHFHPRGVSARRSNFQTKNISVVKSVAPRQPNTKHIRSIALRARRRFKYHSVRPTATVT